MGKWLPEVAARPEAEMRLYEAYDATYGLLDSWQRSTAAAFGGLKVRAVPDYCLAHAHRRQTAKEGWAVVKSSVVAARRRASGG